MEEQNEKEALLKAELSPTSSFRKKQDNRMEEENDILYNNNNSTTATTKYTITSYLNEIGANNFHYILALTMGLGNASDATEIIAMNYYISSDDFLLDFGDSLHLEVLTSAIFFGMLLGGICAGYLGDAIGRRKALLLTLGVNAISGVLSALTSSVFFLSLCRFIAGIGVGGTVPLIFTLSAEMLPTKTRGFFLTIVASFWMVGSLFTSFIAYILLAKLNVSWRLFAFVCALPSALTVFCVLIFIPESPRRLYLRQKYQDTIRVLNKINSYKKYFMVKQDDDHNNYDPLSSSTPPQLTMQNFHVPDRLNVEDGGDIQGVNNEVTFIEQSKKIYSNKKSIYLMLLLQSLWFFLSFSNYGLMTWITTIFKTIKIADPYLDSIIFAAGGLPANILSAYYMDALGGRKVMILSMGLGSIMLFCFAFEVGYAYPDNISFIIVLTACLFNAFATSSWNALDIMSTETFPTDVRSTVMGYLSASGRIGAIAGQIVNAQLINNPTMLIFSSGMIMVLGTIAPMFLPDMSGQNLQERSDGDKCSDDDVDA
jgi:MFS transporter, VNT family, synaptic vesicle glycoprotein 2